MITEIITKAPSTPRATTFSNENLRLLSKKPNMLTVASNYAFKPDDNVFAVLVDASTGDKTVTLPMPSGKDHRRIVKTDGSPNVVTILPSTIGQLISGVYDSVILTQIGTFVELEPTGTGWMVTSARYI
jgi:hypothetical protein